MGNEKDEISEKMEFLKNKNSNLVWIVIKWGNLKRVGSIWKISARNMGKDD